MENFKLLNSKFRMLAAALLVVALMLIMTPKAKAETYNVSNSSACTLEDAFTAIDSGANAGSCPAGEATNTINLAAETFTIGSSLAITSGASLNLVGSGAGQTVIDGVGSFNLALGTNTSNAVFNISSLTLKDLQSLTIQSGGSAFIAANLDNINATGFNPGGGGMPAAMFLNGGSGSLDVTVTKSSFYSNTSSTSVLGFGAGFAEGATGPLNANLVNNTIANNTAPAIISLNASGSQEASATINMTNNTIAGNTGGIIGIPEGSVNVSYNLTNNIFSNSGDNCPASGPSINSLGGNISSDATCATYFTQSTDQNSTDPQLGTLSLDSTTGTFVMPITQSSPAFNKGISSGAPATDQRGIARPQAAAFDSGAYELIASTPTPTPSNNGSLAKTGNDARVPLAIAILLVSIGTVGSVIAFKRR